MPVLTEVAKRLVIPQSAGGQLTQVYNDNAALCQQMQNKMNPTDYDNCTNGTGVSYLTIARAKHCKFQNPNYIVVDRAGGGVPVQKADDELEVSVDRCDDFDDEVQKQATAFADKMGQTPNVAKADPNTITR